MGNLKYGLVASVALVVAACSGGSSSGPDDGGSSALSNSSGATELSSSSASIPAGARPATMDDIPRVAKFPDSAGYEVLYVFGQSGVYSKLFIDGNNVTQLQVIGSYELGTDGTVQFKRMNCIIVENDLDDQCLEGNGNSSLLFVVEDDVLKAGKSETALHEIVAGSLVEKMVVVNNASEVVGAWEYQGADTSYTLQLFSDLRFVLKIVNSADQEVISAGNFDVQNGYLLGTVEYWNGSVASAIMFAAVKKSDKLLLTLPGKAKADTLSAGTLPASISATALLATWEAEKLGQSGQASHVFELELLSGSVVKMRAADASNGTPAYADAGTYVTYGDLLVLDMDGECTGNYTIGILDGATFRCFSQIIGTAEMDGTGLHFKNDFIPEDWTKKD